MFAWKFSSQSVGALDHGELHFVAEAALQEECGGEAIDTGADDGHAGRFGPEVFAHIFFM